MEYHEGGNIFAFLDVFIWPHVPEKEIPFPLQAMTNKAHTWSLNGTEKKSNNSKKQQQFP